MKMMCSPSAPIFEKGTRVLCIIFRPEIEKISKTNKKNCTKMKVMKKWFIPDCFHM